VNKFGDQIRLTSNKDPGKTGNFEITVDGELVHSKKRGDGFFDAKNKHAKVFAAIERAMGSTSKKEQLTDPLVVNNSLIDVQRQDVRSTPQELTEEQQKANRRSLCVSVLTLIISIPALIGA